MVQFHGYKVMSGNRCQSMLRYQTYNAIPRALQMVRH